MNKLISTFLTSLHKLWNTRENLHFGRIRLKKLPFMLVLPLAVIIADMQYSFFGLQVKLYGIDSSTILLSTYSIGAMSIFLLKDRHVFAFIRISMVVTAASFISYFLLPPAVPKLLSAAIGFLGLGGCAISASLFYCASLQNAERLYGAMLLAALSPILIIMKNANIRNAVIDVLIPAFFIATMLYCLYSVKRKDLEQLQMPNQTRHNGSIACELTYALCYFFITYFQSQLFLVQNWEGRIPYLISQVIGVVLVFIIQLMFRRSIWHMWNIYFVLTTVGMLILLFKTQSLLQLSLIILGIATGIGYIAAFYMGAGIIKRNFSMSFFKRTLLVFIVLTLIVILLAGTVASLIPDKLLVITAALSGLSFLIVTILSPVLYKNLFSHDWMDDFTRKNMFPVGDDFNGYGFTDREKEVCRLLLDGYTLRQIASILSLAYPTVNTHYTSIYRKLNINSKAELLLHFKSKGHLIKQL